MSTTAPVSERPDLGWLLMGLAWRIRTSAIGVVAEHTNENDAPEHPHVAVTGPESLAGLPEAEVERRLNGDHGPDSRAWFAIGVWPECICGYAPRDNALLVAHWHEHGIEVVDDHGHHKFSI